MSKATRDRIAFDVETERVLQILSAEIYDSPKAFLRENIQNAYDAILMRCTAQGSPISDGTIQICVKAGRLSVRDNGIGMTEEVLKNNFWKAGSSGKRSDLAHRSGVIGTFGIGAMANFGVCTSLQVESRYIESPETLISSAKRAELRIAQDCIDLERIQDDREPGTIIIADLDPEYSINEADAIAYLRQYVQFLPVPVHVNTTLISQEKFESTLGNRAEGFKEVRSRAISNGQLSCTLHTFLNKQARVLTRLTNIALNDNPIRGETLFVQGGGQTHGFRNLFGLAPIPVAGVYNFGGYVNLDILKPTAGREALSRESIQFVMNLVSLAEAEVSADIACSELADENQQFQQYILSHGLIKFAENVKIRVLPGNNKQVRLGKVNDFEPIKSKLFYAGQDETTQRRFSGDDANLFQVSQTNPRRKLQLRFLREFCRVDEVPEKVHVEPVPQTLLTLEEAMFLVRLKSILLEYYFMPNVEATFATISHNVSLHVDGNDDGLRISIARDMQAARMVVEAYRSAPEVFQGFVIDFVTQHIYPQISERVPSSKRLGRDALYRRLKENEDLFRYDLSDIGDAELLLADYLSGKSDLEQVLKSSARRAPGQRQEVRGDQVGSVEEEIPGILSMGDDRTPRNPYEASPPIFRPGVCSDMKVLTVREQHSKLNGFQMFLSLSERMVRTEGEFLRQPHTTKLMWGSHRVIFVFADSIGGLNLYYDVKLKEPLDINTTGGAMFPTTTIITKDRIFVPVPRQLESAFQISNGAKEFFVRFDTSA